MEEIGTEEVEELEEFLLGVFQESLEPIRSPLEQGGMAEITKPAMDVGDEEEIHQLEGLQLPMEEEEAERLMEIPLELLDLEEGVEVKTDLESLEPLDKGMQEEVDCGQAAAEEEAQEEWEQMRIHPQEELERRCTVLIFLRWAMEQRSQLLQTIQCQEDLRTSQVGEEVQHIHQLRRQLELGDWEEGELEIGMMP